MIFTLSLTFPLFWPHQNDLLFIIFTSEISTINLIRVAINFANTDRNHSMSRIFFAVFIHDYYVLKLYISTFIARYEIYLNYTLFFSVNQVIYINNSYMILFFNCFYMPLPFSFTLKTAMFWKHEFGNYTQSGKCSK